MNASLPIRIGPCNLAVSFDFKRAIGQLEVKAEQGSGTLRFGGQKVHPGFAEVEQDAVSLASVGQANFHRSLHRDAERSSPLAAQQGGCGSKAGLRRLLGNWFVENKVGSAAQDAAYLSGIGHECDSNASQAQPPRLFEHSVGQ